MKRLPNPDDAGGPDEFGDGYGPYEWKYGIKVRLTSLDGRAARQPVAYQFLQLSDGRDSEDGVSGLGRPGGPDPSRPGRSSVGWLHQWAEQGFTPTRVTLLGRRPARHLVAGLIAAAWGTRVFPPSRPCRAIMREPVAAGPRPREEVARAPAVCCRRAREARDVTAS